MPAVLYAEHEGTRRRWKSLAGIAVLFMGLSVSWATGESGQGQKPIEDPRQVRQISEVTVPIKPFWAKRITGYLKTRDGQELHYSVLLPPGSGPFPTLVDYNGYSAGSIGGAGYLGGNVNYPPDMEKQLLDAGYAILGVNARATGCSTGNSFDWLRPLYGQDGYDAVEFAAHQSWSNGSVGMYSWSWAGMSQLWTASFRPPHLKAIAPGHVIADPREDSYAPGGVPQPTMISEWGALYVPHQWQAVQQTAEAEGDARCLQQITRNLELLNEGSPAKLVLKHPLKDDYLEERTVARRTHLINVPVLSLTSFQDWDTTSRGGYYQETVDPKLMWMIDTNGDHGMYASLAYRKTMVEFFDHFVKGLPNGFESTPRLQVWEEAGGPWAEAATQDSEVFETRDRAAVPNFVIERPTIRPQVSTMTFTLAGGGQLIGNGVSSGEAQAFKYPSPGAAVGRDGWGSLPSDWKEAGLTFTSAPLPNDFVTYGPASADLWVSSDGAPDADLQVTVTALFPDGQEIYIERGWLRLSNRAFDPDRSTPSRPIRDNLPGSFAPLPPDQPVLARVEINRFSYPFRKGARLRIWIDTPSPTGDYTFAYSPVPAKLKIWHDQAHPSKLVMSVLPDEPVVRPVRPCGQVIAQPCRPDPLAVMTSSR
jgi:predicted acyl esterase